MSSNRKALNKIWTGDGGSVLTEFLIVAPLYLLLLGGLLLCNDMMRLKLKIQTLDCLVTLTGTHRLMRGDGDKLAAQVNKTWGDFMPKSVKTPLMLANEYQSSEGKTLSNKWNAVYAGRVDAEYHLPTMINALLSVQRIVFGDENYPEHPQVFRFYADSKTGQFPPENVCRFHTIQRHWTTGGGDADYDRMADAYKLVCDQIMSNVLQDGWLFAEEVQGVTSASGNDATYSQQLADYAE
jgi:hypothetical protein